MSVVPYVLRPIPSEAADALRERGGPVSVAGEHPGYPCRQCLRDAEVGDELLLVSYDPFTGHSPYRTSSPIFIHRTPCEFDPQRLDGVPEQLTIRQLSVRAFDRDEMMIDAAVIDGTDLDALLRRFLVDEQADHIHVHNATRGCWAVEVVRNNRGV